MTATTKSAQRRRTILDAALRVFTERGYDEATVDDVRRLSGASVGSIYHHFGSKEQIAGALYADGLADFQRGLYAVLDSRPAAAPGIRALVHHHLQWAQTEPDLARFLLQRRGVDVRAASQERVDELNGALADAFAAWLRPLVADGVVRRVPADLLMAILFGPSQEFVRAWLHGRTTSSPQRARRMLADAAVAALTRSGA